jgi:tetratricopeptide (TPR) repeat protein
MDPGPTISRPYTRHKWVGRMICSQANVSACAQDPLRLPESMTIIKNRTGNLRFSFPLLYNKGLVLDDLRNYTGAIQYYDKAMAIDPKYVYALNNKGKALDDLRNYTGAILYYDKALAIDPRDETTLYNKGAVLNTLGNYTGAILYYHKALTIE